MIRIDSVFVPVIDELVSDWIAWHPLHDVRFGRFISERNGWNEIGAQVDAENCNSSERQRDVGENKHEKRRDFRYVARQRIGDRLLEVVKDQSTSQNCPPKS